MLNWKLKYYSLIAFVIGFILTFVGGFFHTHTLLAYYLSMLVSDLTAASIGVFF